MALRQVTWLIAISDGTTLHLRHVSFSADASAEHIGCLLRREDDRVRGKFSLLIGQTICERVVEVIPKNTARLHLPTIPWRVLTVYSRSAMA